jgi:hypothetical protein
MVRYSRRVVSIVAVVCGLVVGLAGSPALGATRSTPDGEALARRVAASPDPQRALERLGPAERAAVERVVMPVTTTIRSSPAVAVEPETAAAQRAAAAAAVSCWQQRHVAEAKNVFNTVLYSYFQTTRVCISGGVVRYTRVLDPGYHVYSAFWWHPDPSQQAPVIREKTVGWEGRGIAQFYFRLGVGGWDVHRPTNCLQIRLNANFRDKQALLSCDIGS